MIVGYPLVATARFTEGVAQVVVDDISIRQKSFPTALGVNGPIELGDHILTVTFYETETGFRRASVWNINRDGGAHFAQNLARAVLGGRLEFVPLGSMDEEEFQDAMRDGFESSSRPWRGSRLVAHTESRVLKHSIPAGKKLLITKFGPHTHDVLDRWLELRMLGDPVPALRTVENAFGRAEQRALDLDGKPMCESWMRLAHELWREFSTG